MKVAELTLRFGATRLHASVRWPRIDKGWLALALADELTPAHPLAPAPADELTRPRPLAPAPADELTRTHPLVRDSVVVALDGRNRNGDELAALQWLAEHGGELCAAPKRLIVAGGARAAWLAVGAHDSAWPELDRQVLVHPRFGPENPIPSGVAGVAAAIVVCGRDSRDDGPRYAALLRDAGVDVEQVVR
jgi:hypothetical protein